MKVLIAEDDVHMRAALTEILEEEGYDVEAVADGEAALTAFTERKPDFVCLDIMMPKKNGYDVCREIRRADRKVPVIFLSATSEGIDKVIGLELGADDYVMKPFGVKELIARVRAVSRRALAMAAPKAESSAFGFGAFEVFAGELRARRGDETIELSVREVKLLRAFADAPGEVLDRDRLFAVGWGIDHYPNSRTLDQHISRLRKKVEDNPKEPRWIVTVHGAGYRYQA